MDNHEEHTKKSPFAFLQNAKLRILFVLVIVLVLGAALGIYLHYRSQAELESGTATVSGAPDIASVPGAGNPSTAYVKAQKQANVAGEITARKKGTAFVPTITRPAFVGDPSQFGDQTGSSAPICHTKKVVLMYKPNPASCTAKNLDLARQTGVTAEELLCQGCSCPALKMAGFTAGDLRRIGLTPKQLRTCGYSIDQLLQAGFSAAELKKAGFTPKQLAAAGYETEAVPAVKGCSVADIKKERDAGMSATALRQKGCGVAALKAAGFTAAALKNAGFSAADLKKAGYSAADLKKAGFSAAALKKAGFTAGQLAKAGFSPEALRKAGFSAKQLRNAGFTAAQLRNAGFGPNVLHRAGYTNGDLLRGGFSPTQAGYRPIIKKSVEKTPVAQATPLAQVVSGVPSVDQNTMQGRLAQFQKQEQQQMDAQERQDQIQQMQGMMLQQAQKLMVGWSNFAHQTLTQAPKAQKNAAEAAAQAQAAGSKTGLKGPVLKAGTILFGVLRTSINSDEQSPIMARIVAGPLRGSTLLGTFVRVKKRVLIKFNLLSNPRYQNSIALDAVAIDPNTARTAISGQVNNHYLLRYGTLFASAFLQGVSSGIINQGVSADCAAGGLFCIVKTSPLDAYQQVAVGLGKVGQAYAENMGSNFSMPPTIRIAAGEGIGVLLMTDLTLPMA